MYLMDFPILYNVYSIENISHLDWTWLILVDFNKGSKGLYVGLRFKNDNIAFYLLSSYTKSFF